VAAEPEPEPEPVAAQPEPEPVAVAPEPVAPPAPHPVEAARPPKRTTPHEDVTTQPRWPVPPPAPAAPTATPWLTVAPDEPPGGPQWPTPAWRISDSSDLPAMLAGRALLPRDDAAALWAASAREVLTGSIDNRPVAPAAPLSAQPCVNCGLSLSANARFCRRCGARQA
jgi:hypothetical protein